MNSSIYLIFITQITLWRLPSLGSFFSSNQHAHFYMLLIISIASAADFSALPPTFWARCCDSLHGAGCWDVCSPSCSSSLHAPANGLLSILPLAQPSPMAWSPPWITGVSQDLIFSQLWVWRALGMLSSSCSVHVIHTPCTCGIFSLEDLACLAARTQSSLAVSLWPLSSARCVCVLLLAFFLIWRLFCWRLCRQESIWGLPGWNRLALGCDLCWLVFKLLSHTLHVK